MSESVTAISSLDSLELVLYAPATESGASNFSPIKKPKEFYSLDFIVTPDVLIPRPETELLVEQALAWCQSHPRNRYDLLDLGTGSGCIAIAIGKRRPSIHVVASDISEDALKTASENIRRHELTERVRAVQADLLNLPKDAIPSGGFDLIVSNPPYIPETDREQLPQNVRDYEPAVALFSGPDGLEHYRRIATDAPRYLKPGGLLLMEIGLGQNDAIASLMTAQGPFEPTGRYKDANGIDRALAFTLRT